MKLSRKVRSCEERSDELERPNIRSTSSLCSSSTNYSNVNNATSHASSLRSSSQAEFAKTAESIAMANSKPVNIHKEALPKYVPQHIQDNVEACYFTKEQFGWCPMANVDPQVRGVVRRVLLNPS